MIKKINTNSISVLTELARQFATLADVELNTELWVDNWTKLVESGIGTVFFEEKEGKPTGMIGGVAHPDINSGEITATEFFWYVDPEYKGSGLKLLRQFEEWARIMGCVNIVMVHLENNMPEKLKNIYLKKGFRHIESHYSKRL
jgi:GNAT superfamily N-acetyltransferase